jgi:hypothetical protein
VLIKIGDGTQQKRLATPGSPVDADAFAAIDAEFDGADMASAQLLQTQARHARFFQKPASGSHGTAASARTSGV